MRVSLLKENFQKGLSTVNRFLPSKPQIPILSNIYIKASDGEVTLTGTNLETACIVSLGAKVEKPGETTIPGRILTEFISSLPAEKIELTVEKDKVIVTTQKTSATFSTLPVKDFPPLPSTSQEAPFKFLLTQLSKNVGATAFAASIDDGRPILTGIKIKLSGKDVSFFATDGYRLSITHDKIKQEVDEGVFVIPARILSEVIRIAQEEKSEEIGLTVLKEKNQVVFSTKTSHIITRLIDCEFPNVEKIIPVMFKTRVIFDTEKLLSSVKTASLFARGSSNIIKMRIDKSGVSISANTPQVGEDKDFIDALVDGEDIEIAFNYRFLLDLLNNFTEEKIVLETSGPLNPGVFKKNDVTTAFLHIIMPVRVQG